MGKHYCDYCDVFLTHDSVSVRKAHNSGRNHLQNVREYYQNLDPAQVQVVIDALAQEYDRRGIEKPKDLLQPAGSSFMTFGAGPLSGTSERGKCLYHSPFLASHTKPPSSLQFLPFHSSVHPMCMLIFSIFISAFRPKGPPPISMDGGSGGIGGNSSGYRAGNGGYSRYGGNEAPRDAGPPSNYSRPQGGPYSRPPPNMMGSNGPGGTPGPGVYHPREPPSRYGSGVSAPIPAPYISGPPPNMNRGPPLPPFNGSYPPQSRSAYSTR